MQLLQSVSRSFYLTIRFLPPTMRQAVGVAYLLARATDSVADTSCADKKQRAFCLRQMGQAIGKRLSQKELRDLLTTLAEEMAIHQQNPAERRLLGKDFGDCLEELESLPAGQAALVRQVLQTIVEGQLWDIDYFSAERTQVESDSDTCRYTYQVAGCVGEFWTKLGIEAMGEAFINDLSQAGILCQAAIRYGQGLQLINILRDRAEDAARGRSYLCSSPRLWLERAERYMDDGVSYSCRLRSFRLRFASMLPALIGIKTLSALRNSPEGMRVKIPRRAVYGCMAKALWLSALRPVA